MSSTESFSPACEPRKFEFEELAKATRYFSNEQRVGIGDFGDVYEGSLPGVEVNIVVKKLKYKQDEKQEEEFKNQIKDFGIVSHPNLVKLLGYCCEEADRLLVLEFVPNQSLRFHLSDENRRSNLNWSKRMKIAVGSARGLAHLHDECYPKIIHGDIKSDNILLDNDFTPKIAGFELAKFFPETNSVTHISSGWNGINVYADPEDYYPQKDENILQKICEKSDVYSFGVVLLELIIGRTIFDEHGVDIVNWAKPFMFKGDSVEINCSCLVDSALKGDYIKREMELMIYCAAVSVYRPFKLRPIMKQIVEALEGKMPFNELWVAEETTSESKSLTVEDPSETMIPALFRGKSAEFSPPLIELDAQEATASSLFEVNAETSESKSLIGGDPLETMIPAQFREMRSLPKDYEAYELRKFTFPELAIATGHLSNFSVLGQGGFGTVYWGTLPQGITVAIKRLFCYLDRQQQEEFEKEINAVGNVRHENLVKLIGYCHSGYGTLLVSEFVLNESLRFHLNYEERRSNLKWSERMKIAIGSAKGLAYLHEECNPKIIHGDIKAENILLDDNCEPKILDLPSFFHKLIVSLTSALVGREPMCKRFDDFCFS